MNAKKILGFLVMRPAFTQRNISSLLLVGVFVGAYVLMGGKITTELPRPPKGNAFGSLQRPAGSATDRAPAAEQESEEDTALKNVERKLDPAAVLGAKPTAEQAARQRAILSHTDTTPEERAEAAKEKLDPNGLIKGTEFRSNRDQWRLKQSEKKELDSLDAIEERLKINRANN